ncbi:MAG: hypothetical protein RLZZ255_783 [Cyanobacteriota bacterium]|jgi:hypothetical protein
MATSSAVDTNISNLPAADQARTDITTSGTTTTVTVTGPALRNLVVETNTLAPSLKLDGSFRSSSFVGGAAVPEKFTVTGGNKVSKSSFVLGSDSFDDKINFKSGASAKGVVIKDFAEGDTLKYKGKTYTAADINGNKFDGISSKEIRLG